MPRSFYGTTASRFSFLDRGGEFYIEDVLGARGERRKKIGKIDSAAAMALGGQKRASLKPGPLPSGISKKARLQFKSAKGHFFPRRRIA